MFLSGETGRTTLNLKLWLPPAHFGVLMPTEQQPNKRIPELGRVIKLVYHEEPELLLHNEGRRGVAWRISWGPRRLHQETSGASVTGDNGEWQL